MIILCVHVRTRSTNTSMISRTASDSVGVTAKGNRCHSPTVSPLWPKLFSMTDDRSTSMHHTAYKAMFSIYVEILNSQVMVRI